MSSGANTTTDQIRIVVSQDRMRAWIQQPATTAKNFSAPSEEDVASALTAARIEITDQVRQRLSQYLGLLGDPSTSDSEQAPPEIPERFLIAEGRAAVEGRDGKFEWDEAFNQQAQNWQGDSPINYYTLNSILTIEAGAKVGRLIQPSDGELGVDVLGQELRPRRFKGSPVKLATGLRLAENDPAQVVTEVSGRLVQEANTLRMNEVLKIPGDVDFESGNIDSVIDVQVCGSVKPNFSVKTAKSLTVQHAVEAAALYAKGDIQVRGGIFGQESGRLVKAEGSIVASICDAAVLEAAGDVLVSKEILNSDVRAGGELRIEHGSIIGGAVYARNGAKIKHAGSEVGVPTRIAVGVDGALLYRAKQIETRVKERQRQAEHIRARVAPLLANLRRLNPSQREQATELVAKLDEIDCDAGQMLEQRQKLVQQAEPDRGPRVEVSGTLHPGVELLFGLRQTRIKSLVKGPVTVEERKVEGATEIVVINQLTGSVTLFPSAMMSLEHFEQENRAAGETAGAEEGDPADGNV